MRTWLSRLWASFHRHRWERSQVRDQIQQARSEAHVDRQEAGIRDNPPPPMMS